MREAGAGVELSLAEAICSPSGDPPRPAVPAADPQFCAELAAWIAARLGTITAAAENGSAPGNASVGAEGGYPAAPVYTAVLSVLLGVMILLTVLGNVFVIAAILLERNLQNVANYLIVSLAVADLMVACLVMPLGAVYEISEGWILGPQLCDMWTSSDVLCCTASILHLVAIAVDRYWAVTNVDYIHNRTSSRIIGMIGVVWSVALVVSLAPQFGWKDPAYLERITQQQRCLVSQDVGYQIFATCSTFYVPLAVILILYWKIFQTARTRIRRRTAKTVCSASRPPRKFKFFSKSKKSGSEEWEGGSTGSVVVEELRSAGDPSEGPNTPAFTISNHSSLGPPPQHQPAKRKRDTKRETLEAKRERKAAKTLAIITGAFVVCWLPFFVMALLMPLCPSCQISDTIASLFLWLGYFNSTLNPIIYTIFSPEFRNAFKRILCGVSSHSRTLR